MDIKPLHLAEATLSITVSPAADGKVLIEFSTEDAQDFALTILDQVEATKKPPESLN